MQWLNLAALLSASVLLRGALLRASIYAHAVRSREPTRSPSSYVLLLYRCCIDDSTQHEIEQRTSKQQC